MSVVSRLSPKDRKALADFYGTDTHTALLHLNKLVKANAGLQALKATDYLGVKYLQGQKSALEEQEAEIYKVYKAQNS